MQIRRRLGIGLDLAKALLSWIMTFEEMPGEWQEWLELTPIERFRESEKLFAQYIAMGGSLDPDPDPTSPFYDAETSSTGAAYGRPGLCILRRGAV
jgi:hypothetical protein